MSGDAQLVLIMLVVMVFLFWFVILLPAQMAASRGRSAIIWVCISVFGSPFLAILLLLALGNAPDRYN